jgi:hypothetical protein
VFIKVSMLKEFRLTYMIATYALPTQPQKKCLHITNLSFKTHLTWSNLQKSQLLGTGGWDRSVSVMAGLLIGQWGDRNRDALCSATSKLILVPASFPVGSGRSSVDLPPSSARVKNVSSWHDA